MAGVVCGHCGASNPDGSQFCESCDGYLDWDGGAQPQPAAARPPAPQPAPYPPPPAPPPPPMPQPVGPQGGGAAPPLARPAPHPPPQYPPQPYAPQPHPPQQPYAPQQPYPGPNGPPPPGGAPGAWQGQPPPSAHPTTCAVCGMHNDANRRFCRRCGSWVVTPFTLPHVPQEALRTRLRRSWWGGNRGAYTGSLTRSTIAFRVLAGVIATVIVAVVLTLVGFHPIRRTSDLVGHILGSNRMDGVTATAQPSDALPGHPAAWAVDDIRGRGWATRWTAATAGEPGAACRAPDANIPPPPAVPATASTLVLTFRAPTDVREIGIEAGLPADDPDRGARWRPRTLELRWTGGACQSVDLADAPGLQRFGVDKGKVGDVTVTVVAGYPPANAGTDRLDIGEVTFWQR